MLRSVNSLVRADTPKNALHHILIKSTAKERYDKILHTPTLQNKLLEHIQERALHFKPALIQMTLEEFGKVPPWINSIE